MLQASLRAPITRLITPFALGLIRLGISANLVTAFGAFSTLIAALVCFPSGHFFAGSLIITFFVLFDLFDGTIARLSKTGGTRFGALLDSTLDRVSDSAIMGSILIYLMKHNDKLSIVLLTAIVSSFLVSYVKARAEAVGIVCNGGLAERTERLVLILFAAGMAGLGLAYVLAIGIWILAIVSVITVIQRMVIVFRADN